MTDRLLTYTDAARIAGVSHTTIRRWVADGYLPCSPMPRSTRTRIREGTLVEFLRSLERKRKVPAKFETNESG